MDVWKTGTRAAAVVAAGITIRLLAHAVRICRLAHAARIYRPAHAARICQPALPFLHLVLILFQPGNLFPGFVSTAGSDRVHCVTLVHSEDIRHLLTTRMFSPGSAHLVRTRTTCL